MFRNSCKNHNDVSRYRLNAEIVDTRAIARIPEFASRAVGVQLATNLLKASTKKAGKFGEKFSHTVANSVNTIYTESFLRVISCMDASGLARVAELLSRVQELRCLCGPTQATVGGAIELLTIAKDEGIHWDRKYGP